MQRTVEMGSRNTSDGDGGSWVSMALETVLAFAGVVTMVLALRLAGPTVVWFLAAEVPRAYASALAWLRPPYIYLVINGIIITIAASFRFQKHPAADPSTLPVMNLAEVQREMKLAEDEPRRELSGRAKAEPEVEVEVEVEEEFVISTSSWSPKRRRGSLAEMPTEYSVAAEAKPLLSTRFGHPKAAETSADGKALGLARRNETLESTWRTITERRARPVKKSDTWDTRSGVCREEPAAAMRKSETLIEAAGAASRERPRREASKGQEELNRRVEAFIRKFNQEMRLQRQESLKHHMERINRGNH